MLIPFRIKSTFLKANWATSWACLDESRESQAFEETQAKSLSVFFFW